MPHIVNRYKRACRGNATFFPLDLQIGYADIPSALRDMEDQRQRFEAGYKKVWWKRAFESWPQVLATARNQLFTGIFLAIPLVVTFWVLRFFYDFINGISSPWLARVGLNYPGMGFMVTLLLLLLLGFMATNVFGKRIIEAVEGFLLKIPVVATIYTGVKQVMDSVTSFSGPTTFKRVAYVEYPAPGCRLIGFVTGQFCDSDGCDKTAVFLPTAPNPMTGLVIVVASDQVIDSELTMEEAMKLIVSAGLVVPRRKVEAVGSVAASLHV